MGTSENMRRRRYIRKDKSLRGMPNDADYHEGEIPRDQPLSGYDAGRLLTRCHEGRGLDETVDRIVEQVARYGA